MSAATTAPLPPRVSRAAASRRSSRRRIARDGRRPGDRIATKDELRERFGVAVATINEAVRLLETRGVIEARPGPGGGIFVARAVRRVRFAHDAHRARLPVREHDLPRVPRSCATRSSR